MLNTLAIVKKMTAAGMPVAQAEGFAQTLTEAATEHLATKRDVRDLGEATKRDVENLSEAMKRDLLNLGETTRRDVQQLGDDLRREMKIQETGLKRDIKDLEVTMLHQMKEQLSSIERILERMQFQMLRVGMAIGLGVVGVMGGLMRYF